LEFNGLRRQKLSKYLTQTFMSHCNEMICQQVTLSGYAERPKVADAVIKAGSVQEYSGQGGHTMHTLPRAFS